MLMLPRFGRLKTTFLKNASPLQAVVKIPEERCRGLEDGIVSSIDECGCDEALDEGYDSATFSCVAGAKTDKQEKLMCSLGPSPGWNHVKW